MYTPKDKVQKGQTLSSLIHVYFISFNRQKNFWRTDHSLFFEF